MSEKSAKKKVKDEEAEGAAARTLEELVLNKKSGKYPIVPLISYWAKELRKQEEHRHLTQNEILELAMTEVLGGKVSEKELAKGLAAAEKANAAAEAADKAKKKTAL